ncbi:hypothetical protein SAMN02745163_00167 [Clostridium cavendishii DSM 21758]|uniref:Uncharacterized protein n=1 Tax=Clostridium cavendishii DSM 21758 TaxID=1121302 RepID=A0A1M6ASU3_9CLOT|nr:hypothetical protein [Clostridium cavendishii]SHI39501.1 hypothetical protein SAMN02745163_00167 [Clostridium cavendishii DSM 21758]
MIPIFLIAMAIIIIILNVKTLKQKENSFEEIVKSKEDSINDYEVEIGKLRREFSESLTELQGEIYSLKEELAFIKENFQGNKMKKEEDSILINNEENNSDNKENNFEENTLINEINYDNNNIVLEEDESESSSNMGFKVNEVHRLISLGLTDDQICETLGLGKGEVLLIKGLYKE